MPANIPLSSLPDAIQSHLRYVIQYVVTETKSNKSEAVKIKLSDLKTAVDKYNSDNGTHYLMSDLLNSRVNEIGASPIDSGLENATLLEDAIAQSTNPRYSIAFQDQGSKIADLLRAYGAPETPKTSYLSAAASIIASSISFFKSSVARAAPREEEKKHQP